MPLVVQRRVQAELARAAAHREAVRSGARALAHRVAQDRVEAAVRVRGGHGEEAGARRGVLPYRGVVESLLEYRLVVIHILHRDPDRGAAAAPGPPPVTRDHHQPRLGVRLAVHARARHHEAGVGLDVEPVRVRVRAVPDPVADAPVSAHVGVRGGDPEHGGAGLRGLVHAGLVLALREHRRVVVHVRDPDLYCGGGLGRGGGGQLQGEGVPLLAVQRPGQHQLPARHSPLQLEGVLVPGQGEDRPLPRLLVCEGHGCQHGAHRRVLAQLRAAAGGEVAEGDAGLLVRHVRDPHRDEGRGLLRHLAAVRGHHHQLVAVLGLEVQPLVDAQQPAELVDGEELARVGLPPVDGVGHLAVVAQVGVRGGHRHHARAHRGVLGHGGGVALLAEGGRVVVQVEDGHVDRDAAAERGPAPVRGLDHELVRRVRLAVQEAVNLEVEGEHAGAVPLGGEAEGVVGVAAHDGVALRGEGAEVPVYGGRQLPPRVPRRVLGQPQLHHRAGEGRGVVVHILDLDDDLDVLPGPGERDGGERVAVPGLAVQLHLGPHLARVLVDVQVRVDGAVRHGHHQVGRGGGRGRAPRRRAPDEPDPGAGGRALPHAELAHILAAHQRAAGQQQPAGQRRSGHHVCVWARVMSAHVSALCRCWCP